MAADAPIPFPPLPGKPEPPVVGADRRQAQFRGIAAALSEATAGTGRLRSTNLDTGFPASAPSLGAIKDAHENALSRFDMRSVRDRWDKDVARWLQESLLRWIQRTKQLTTKLCENGIAIEIEAQDDLGYYRYAFDIMAREAPGASN